MRQFGALFLALILLTYIHDGESRPKPQSTSIGNFLKDDLNLFRRNLLFFLLYLYKPGYLDFLNDFNPFYSSYLVRRQRRRNYKSKPMFDGRPFPIAVVSG